MMTRLSRGLRPDQTKFVCNTFLHPVGLWHFGTRPRKGCVTVTVVAKLAHSIPTRWLELVTPLHPAHSRAFYEQESISGIEL